MKRVETWLAAAGLLLLIAGYLLYPHPLSEEDELEAYRRLAGIPLDQLKKDRSATLTATIPDNPQWDRIRKKLGDPGYVIAAQSRGTQLLQCWDRLSLKAEIFWGDNRVPLDTAKMWPYRCSGTCPSCGLAFWAAPSTKAMVRVTVTSDEVLPEGELIFIAHAPDKDHAVGVLLDHDLQKMCQRALAMGVVLILGSSALVLRRRMAAR